MLKHRALQFGVVVIAMAAGSPFAWATLENGKTYKRTYPGQDAKAYSCKTCHEAPVGKATNLNAYGKALQQFKGGPGTAKALTAEDYQAFDTADTDADGAANRQELDAGTDPLDPASVSSGAPAPAAPAPGEGEPSSRLPERRGVIQAYLGGLIGEEAWAETETPEEAGEPKQANAAEAPVEASAPPQADYVGAETCAGCHAQQWKEFEHSTHARISIPGEQAKAQGCEMCHGPGSLHVEAGGGRGVGGIINPRKDPSSCFACHLDKKAEFRLPHHHPLLEGKMSCADCHNAHAPDVRPWSSTSLKDINEACFRCHKEQRGPFVWEHEALREGCTTCHKVHGSIHEKMVVARDNNLCLRCHTQVNFPTIGKSNHGSRLPSGSCFSAGCHTAVHGSNFDEHLRY
jgi:predicted CXXCH cytochrome family protein